MTRVLVVDDEPDLRLLVRLSLEMYGYAITEAGSGEEALETIHGDPPDIVLLDIKLPGIDGWEVLRRLRENANGRPRVIMLSAHASDATSQRALEAGCVAYVAKPFQPDDLIDAIEISNGKHAAE
jgi:CheY-like chemotaxis protein